LVVPLPLDAAGFVFILFALLTSELLRRESAYLHPVKLGGKDKRKAELTEAA